VFYLQGDPFNEKDLLRAEAHKAKACIIFNDKNSKDPFSGDQQAIIVGSFIKKFVYNHNRVLAQKNLTLRSLMDFSNSSFRLCLQLNKPNKDEYQEQSNKQENIEKKEQSNQNDSQEKPKENNFNHILRPLV